MIMCGTYTAKCAKGTPMIVFIEFEFPKVSEVFLPEDLENRDVILSCDWDESDWEYDSERGVGSFRAKGLYLNQKYANGHIADFADAKVAAIQVSADRDSDFTLTGLMIEDNGELFTFPGDRLAPWTTDYVE